MNELSIELSCPNCGRETHVPFSDLKADSAACPGCGAEIPVTEDQIDAAVERRMRAQRKAMKPKFGGL